MDLFPGLNAATRQTIQQKSPHLASKDDRDVIALVRQFMADETLSQDPLLVIPAALQNAAKQYFRDVNTGNVVVDPKNRSVEHSAEL